MKYSCYRCIDISYSLKDDKKWQNVQMIFLKGMVERNLNHKHNN